MDVQKKIRVDRALEGQVILVLLPGEGKRQPPGSPLNTIVLTIQKTLDRLDEENPLY
ncbi:MAG: hypothetical protein RIM23_25185 [Coleofasciculus sp. G3-WIS-01]|uniref:hypothetical protein n=1 Tax=Coleofasciculus sp. G3-WIS-01 TaxID=3069528 RepID=UPI0032FD17CA